MKISSNIVCAFFATTFLFGLLTWGYVILVMIIHPDWVADSLTHLRIFPLNMRVDVTGIVAFIVSALSFFLLQLTPRPGRK